MKRAYPYLRVVTAAACAYEAAAILTRKGPTFSVLAQRHKWVGPLLTSALVVHLALMPETESGLQAPRDVLQ